MKKILVVGKDPKTCEDLRKHFDPQEYILFSSYDPKNAIASTINLKPDLVILDLNLPVHSGIEVLNKLKESNSNLPIIAITESSSNLGEMDIIKEKVHALMAGGLKVRATIHIYTQRYTSPPDNTPEYLHILSYPIG